MNQVETTAISAPEATAVEAKLMEPTSDNQTDEGSGDPAPAAKSTYVVQEGDTLMGIAIKHGLREFDLRQSNHLIGGHIYQGQVLKIRHRIRVRSQSLPSKALEHFLPNDASRRPPKSILVGIPECQKTAPSAGSNNQDSDEKRPVSPCPSIVKEPTPEPVSCKCPLLTPTSIPKLLNTTPHDILSHPTYTKYLVPRLEACLPARHRGYDWKIAYSLAQHGASLGTLYRNVKGKRPTLVVVETGDGDVFGGFASMPWAPSQSYYGNGECFLFTCTPTFEHFAWKGNNAMIMFSNDSMMAMGGGGGFAWAVNSDLSRGSSAHSLTFENRCLAHRSDFDVINFEVWELVSKYTD
ncbi:oxidation resistance protein 1 isoform X9 [Achlya hypogyna]|uniref:Oxidation resistance protein 1 n=1 Tax=Achlya hypogyna TaxID=1202772 RepID=A0A1V9ZKV2_ACHHY|nr:oxidation resistance protein 1 isoform X9 [Achlya hypogyna]